MRRSGRALLLFLIAILGPLGGRAGEAVWVIEGEALRQSHADTLEDLLRELPYLRVDRFGGPGLPYRARPSAVRDNEILLMVDGQIWQDRWTGLNLYEELPLALVERVEYDPRPAVLEYGPEALGGVIRVTTRRFLLPRVQARISLARGPFVERTRRISFETPPGSARFAWGLDEFFTTNYSFSLVRGGTYYGSTAEPEVTYSRRRAMAMRLDLDGGAAGPIEFQLLQTTNWLDLGFFFPERTVYRNGYQLSLALPELPIGVLRLGQRILNYEAERWSTQDAMIWTRLELPPAKLLGGRLRVLAGSERHQMGLQQDDYRRNVPRPFVYWGALGRRGRLFSFADLGGGLRYEVDRDHEQSLLYEADLGWPAGERDLKLELFAAGGPPATNWDLNRLPGKTLWPEGTIRPDTLAAIDEVQRYGARMAMKKGRYWAEAQIFRRQGGEDWILDSLSEGLYAWQAQDGVARSALGFHMGGRWLGKRSRAASTLNLLFTLEEGGAALEPHPGAPYYGRYGLELSRPFFKSDATIYLEGSVEARWGNAVLPAYMIVNFDIKLRVLDARFWMRLGNIFDAPGEEIRGISHSAPRHPIRPRLAS